MKNLLNNFYHNKSFPNIQLYLIKIIHDGYNYSRIFYYGNRSKKIHQGHMLNYLFFLHLLPKS